MRVFWITSSLKSADVGSLAPPSYSTWRILARSGCIARLPGVDLLRLAQSLAAVDHVDDLAQKMVDPGAHIFTIRRLSKNTHNTRPDRIRVDHNTTQEN